MRLFRTSRDYGEPVRFDDSPQPVNRDDFCSWYYGHSHPSNHWVSKVLIKNSSEQELLNVSYAEATQPVPHYGRDETSKLIICDANDVLSVTVEWCTGYEDCDYYGIIWAHTAGEEDLTEIDRKYKVSGPCGWPAPTTLQYSEHTFSYTVPNNPGTHMFSIIYMWLGNNPETGWYSPCMAYVDYGDKVDYTLVIQ